VNYVRAVITIAILVFLLLVVWIGTSSAENCSVDGGLECSDAIASGAPFAFLLGLVALSGVTIAGLRRGVLAFSARDTPKPDRYECRKCGERATTEEEAIEHAEGAHGLISYPEMKDSWIRV
jgi:hypothetical protein